MRGLRTGSLLLLVLCLGAQPPGRAASLYHIDQRHGIIEFSVGILGMFSVQGRFVSGPIQALSPSRYLIHGTLWIRGIAQPQDLDAVIQDRHTDMARRIEVADFVGSGRIRRSAFGMVADRIMVSDTVRITIRIHLEVGLAPDGG